MAVAPLPAPSVQVAPDLAMPASQTCTQTLGAIGAKGAGKSYLAGVIVEGLFDAGAPFAVFDPIGNWHALTRAADGKGPGLGVVVIGGEQADVPLDEHAAEALGTYLLTEGVSAVIDVSELSKGKRKSYVAAIAEAMYIAARRVKQPYMVVLEEAQLFAPQVCPPGEQRMLGAITDIVRLGRNHGLGAMLLTQRPQSVSKEVLNQIECLFVGQLRGPQERKAIAGWVSEQNAEGARAGLDELPKLSPGEFFAWSPSWLRTFRKIRVAKKRTFDGSSTPVLGQRMKALPKNDRAELASIIKALVTLAEPASDKPAHVLTEDVGLELANWQRKAEDLERENLALANRVAQAEEIIRQVRAALDLDPKVAMRSAVRHAMPRLPRAPDDLPLSAGLKFKLEAKQAARQLPQGRAVDKQRVPGEVPRRSTSGELDGPMRKILTVLVVHGGMTKRKLALLAGYSARGGGFGNPLSRLRTAGFVEGTNAITATDAGRRTIGTVDRPPPRGRALLEWWCERIDGPMQRILSALAACSPRQMKHPHDLARLAGYTPGTGGFNNPLSRLKTLGLIVGGTREGLRLAEELR